MHFPITEVQAVVAAAQQPQRFDIYGTIHKALRHAMGQLLLDAGRLDVNDDAARQRLCDEVATFADFCRGHLDHENTYIHPALEARAPGTSQRIAGEHVQHERDIAALHSRVHALASAGPGERSACAATLYHALALFIAHNLAHMYIEETEHNQLLWQHYSDAEIVGIHDVLVSNVPPVEMGYALRWMIPAMTPQERVLVLGGIRATAPAPAFEGVMTLAREVLDDTAWQCLDRELCQSGGA